MLRNILFICLFLVTFTASSEFRNGDSNRPKDIFADVITDDFSAATFLGLQWSYINTPGDAVFLNFFKNTSGLGIILENIREQLNAGLDDFSRLAQVSMLKLGPGLTSQYNLIDEMVKSLAADLGFSEKAIMAREVYVTSGGMNAFTVSGNKDRIIVVLQSELISKMSLSEIKAVLAHEMGHIRSMHTSTRFLHTLMMDMIANQFGVSDILDRDSKNSYLTRPSCAHHKYDRDKRNIGPIATSNFSAIIAQGQQALAQIDPQSRDALSRMYLKDLLRNLEEAEVPANVITYFAQLMNSLGQGLVIGLNAEQMNQHMEVALNAISRNNEKSADRYSTSVVPNIYAGSAFLKLVGIDFTKSEREIFLKKTLQTVEEFKNKTPEDERALFVGTTHPSLNLRIAGILEESSYPAILFANPFLRIMLLEESLRANAKRLNSADELPFERNQKENEIAQLRARIVESIGALGYSSQQNPRFENAIQYLSLGRESLLRRLEDLRASAAEVTTAGEDTQLFNDTIEIFEYNLNQENPMIVDLLKNFKAEFAKVTREDPQFDILWSRVSMLETLLTSQVADQLKNIRIDVTHPLRVNDSRRIPIDIEAKDCTLLLTSAF